MRPPVSDARGSSDAVDVLAEADPVAAVLEAHRSGRRLLLRTGGTTGDPRVVVRTTRSWFDSFGAYTALTGVGPGAVVAVVGPMTATMNLFAGVHARWAGAQVTADLEAATHVVLTPAQLHTVLDADADAGTVPAGVVAIVAGDRLTPALASRARAAGLEVHHYYGAAELSFVAWGPHAEELSVFPGVEAIDRDGELFVRSPYVAEGVADADGWAGVGDRGRVDGPRVLVEGRPGAVTTAGATVELSSVEAALGDLGVVVVGVPHPRLGAVLVAVLPGHVAVPDARRAARHRLPATHRPRRWVHRSDLPLTRHGKIDRDALARELVADPSEEPTGPTPDLQEHP